MKFTKMHGLGNDYVYVNVLTENISNPSEVAKIVSDRHFGIGSDGLILICPSQVADVKMEMYNADGSVGLMCGNGIRCVAKYIYDYGIIRKNKITIETLSGIKEIKIFTNDSSGFRAEVNMGQPKIYKKHMPITIGEDLYYVDFISMGNPHVVVYMKNLETINIENLGPKFEYHSDFGERVNVEFVHVMDRRTSQIRVWERGAGETFACGTGACATAVSCILNDLTERQVQIKLKGGNLLIKWSRDDGDVYMTGSAVTVFEGEINI